MTREPSEPSEPAQPAQAPEELLISAIDQLPAEDRQAVLTWLVARLGGPLPINLPRQLLTHSQLPAASRERAAAMVFEHRQASLSEEQRVVPVRFSASQHAALQAWCQEHGFSMATVVRGLVARFLAARASDADPDNP
jgi:hypothetical protein